MAEEVGVTVPVVRRKASRIHCELISYMENYFIEKPQGSVYDERGLLVL